VAVRVIAFGEVRQVFALTNASGRIPAATRRSSRSWFTRPHPPTRLSR